MLHPEKRLQYLLAARQAYVNYISNLEQIQLLSPFNPVTAFGYIIAAGSSYLKYQSYLEGVKNNFEQVFECGEIEDSATYYSCVENFLESEFGVKIPYRAEFTAIAAGQDSRIVYSEVLYHIRDTCERIGKAIKIYLIESLEACEQTVIASGGTFNINIDDFRSWTDAQTFKNVFMREFDGQKRTIEIRYEPNRAFSYAVTPPTDGITNPRVYLAKSSFINPNPPNEVYSHQVVVEIIAHELGHIFANSLGVSENAWGLEINPLDSTGNPQTIMITADGGGSGSPLVVEEYLQATQSYFAGINADLGNWYRFGGFQFGDEYVDALTKTNYEQFVTISSCANCTIDNFLVDIAGNCVPDSNNECIAPAPSTAQTEAVYARLPGTYIPNFTNMPTAIRDVYFKNEIGETTESSAPKEGYADLFKVGMVVEGGITILSSTEPRRMFFEEFIGKWLFQLLAEWIPENEVSQCVD